MKRILLFLALAPLVLDAMAAGRDFANEKEAMAELYPQESLIDTVAGDLNGDGRPEVVVTLRPDWNEGVRLRVVVLTTNERGRLERWIETGSVGECRHSTAISIQDKALVLACVSWLGTHGGTNTVQTNRFVFRRGTLLLAGQDVENTEDMNGPKETSTTESSNFLTGQILETRDGKRISKRLDPAIKKFAQPLSSWEGW